MSAIRCYWCGRFVSPSTRKYEKLEDWVTGQTIKADVCIRCFNMKVIFSRKVGTM